MSYMTDPRPFSDVLKSFIEAESLTVRGAAALLRGDSDAPSYQAVHVWKQGRVCGHEAAYRALMDVRARESAERRAAAAAAEE